MRSHSVTCHPTQVNAPHFNTAMHAVTRFTYPGGMEGWVDLGVRYIIQRWFTCPQTVSHLSSNHLNLRPLHRMSSVLTISPPSSADAGECGVRWVASLPLARVLRWGGMISTPDAALQSVMRRSLLDSGCPVHCVDELMDSAHERRWPPGLGTLEMRQQNRRHFENYVCRRIPGTCC